VEIVLSGMNTPEQVRANIQPFVPLDEEDTSLLSDAAQIICGKTAIGCTGCGYCAPHCPKQIPIPQYIKLCNEITRDPGDDWKILPAYNRIALSAGKASHCIGCHSCEKHCPQNLGIAEHMKTIAKLFE